ncbi:MAG: dockerin type I domain-containing protein [Saprospiraceae bacterium]
MRQIKNTILIMVAVVAVVSQLVGQACTITAPANVTVNSTPGICGANVTLASAVAGTACQSVTTVALGSQNFDGCTQPAGWTTGFTEENAADGTGSTNVFADCNSAGLFTFGCNSGGAGPLSASAPANAGFLNCAAYISDDNAGSAFDGIAWIDSPVAGVAPVAGKTYEVKFGYYFDNLGAQFRVDVWNGSAWINKHTSTGTADASGVLSLNVTAEMNPGFKVRFIHDDLADSWAWGVGIDNFAVNELTVVPAIIANSFTAGGANASGTYPVGTTTVTYSIVGANPAVTATQTVTVNDTQAPTLVCPANITYSLKPGECSQLVTYTVTGSDNCPFIGPAQTLNTITTGGNGNSSGGQVFFNLVNNSTSNILINAFKMNITGATMVNVHRKVGTHVGSETNAAAWTLHGQANAMTGPFSGPFPGNGTLTTATLATPLILSPGTTTGIALTTLSAASNYTNGNGGNQTYSDANITLNAGATNNSPWTAVFTPRVFNGAVVYQAGSTVAPVMQTAGLPSGAEFVIGTTTNSFKLTDVAGNMATCSFNITVQEYPFATTALACNDLVNISLGDDCQVVVNADMVLEGGPYGCYDEYIVNVTGGGNVISTPGAYGVTVTDPETGNSCWGNIVAEDKLPPVITCGDFTVTCIDPIPAVPVPPFNGNKIPLVTAEIPFEGGAANAVTLTYTVPAHVTCNVTDLDVLVNVANDWMGDMTISVTSPSGTTSTIWGGFCGFQANGVGVNFVCDDEGAVTDLCVDYQSGNNHTFPGLVPTPAFTAFDGEPLAGTWTLKIVDNFDDGGVDGIVKAAEFRFNGCQQAGFFPQGPCGEDYTWTFADHVANNGCDGDVITRTWTAKDASNNAATCVQTITVENITLEDVLLPPSLVLIENCGAGVTPKDVAAYYDVDSRTGAGVGGFNDDWTEAQGSPAGVIELNEGIPYAYPHYYAVGRDGNLHPQPIDNNVCSIYATYTDQTLSACGIGCGGNSKVIRTWTLLDWCTLETANYVQIIKAVDTKAPTFIVKDVTVSVNPWGCVANFQAPMPWELQDNCDAHPVWWLEGPAGVVITGNPTDGYFVTGAPKGRHAFTYKAVDCCGNIGSATAYVTVIDRSAPVAVAKQNIVISLTGSGTAGDGAAKLYAWMVDNGSYDHCTAVKLEIRRPDGSPDCGNLGVDDHNNNVTFDDDDSASPQVRWAHPNDSRDDTDNGAFVKFCCEDLGSEISVVHQVTMRVWDDGNMNGVIGDNLIIDGMQDNYNETWADIRVENKIPPVLVCPLDATITCDMELNLSTSWKSVEGVNLTMTGGPAVAYDLCNGIGVEYKDTPSWTNTCENVGKIRREFRAVKGDKTVNCYQTITVNALPSTFVVTPPSSSVLDAPCDFNEDDIKASDKPKVQGGPCDVIGENIHIDTFLFEDGVCKKWRVTYNYINWCTGEQKGPYVKYYKFKDDEKPVLTCQDQMFAANPNPQNPNGNCEGTVNLEATATDGGGCSANGWLKWQVFVDLWGNGTVDLEYSSFLPTTDNNINNDTNGNGIKDRYVAPTASGGVLKVPAFVLDAENSVHKVQWKVTDGCGNVTDCYSTFMVVDKKAPTPYCLSLSSAVMQNGQVELWAIDFDKGSFDNCTPKNALMFTFNGEFPVWSRITEEHYFKGAGLSATVAEYNAGNAQKWVPSYRSSAMIFNCDDVEASPITLNMSVWDARQNTDFCSVELTLIDNQGGCGGSRVAGNLTTKANEAINTVTVKVDASLPEFPRYNVVNGNYDLGVPNGDMTVSASKTDDYTNGVSTLDLVLIQRHILGLTKLDSPEKLLAADVNKDGKVTASDLVELRKLILSLSSKLNNNDSWIFVPKSHTYADANNPWNAPRSITVTTTGTPVSGLDFTGIKVGDVNNDAVAATGVAADSRSSKVLKFVAEDKTVNAGEIVTIDVTANNFNEVFGYQFTAKMNGMELMEVKSGAITVDESNYGVPTAGTMTMSWSSEKAVNATEGEVLFTVVMKATENGRLSNMMSVGSDVTRSESYAGSEMETNRLDLSFRTNESEVAGYALYQNEPNPFKTNTVVNFNMPAAGEATFTVTDVTGKLVHTRKVNAVKGMNKVEFNRTDVPVSGVVYYTIESGDFTATKAMIVIE